MKKLVYRYNRQWQKYCCGYSYRPPPVDGKLIVDGMDLYDSESPERLLAWQLAIAHVPQNIYLSDSSIAENIAYGSQRYRYVSC